MLSVVLIIATKRALAPLNSVCQQVEKVDAGLLHFRIAESEVPTEITPLINRLNLLLERLEQSFKRERQFNGDLAHELRTPLAAIRTTSEVALKWPEQSTHEDFEYIAQSSAQLQQTIDGLLSLTRIESTGAEASVERVNLVNLIEECQSLHSARMKERNINIHIHIDPDFFLVIDPRLFRIIVTNLIGNATEYAPVESDVLVSNREGHSVLTISNLAPNLLQADVDTMFDRLWRKDVARTDSTHVGLGLSIASTAAENLSLQLEATLKSKTLSMTLKKITNHRA
jgi:signal transduction histidine kinase